MRLLQSKNLKVTSSVCAIYYSLRSSSHTSLVSAVATRSLSYSSSTSLCFSPKSTVLFPSSSNKYRQSTGHKTAPTSRSSLMSSISTPISSTSSLTIAQIPCLNDNYGYLIHDPETGHTAAVDTPDANAYEKELKKRGWKLSHIFK